MNRRRLTPLWVLGMSLLFTAGATLAFRQAVVSRDQARFQNAVESTQDRIANRLDSYVAVLLATRGLFAATGDVTDEGFREFTAGLDLQRRYPGVQGIGFSQRVDRAGIPELERRMREAGFTEITRCAYGESAHAELRGLETRPDSMLILEAVRR